MRGCCVELIGCFTHDHPTHDPLFLEFGRLIGTIWTKPLYARTDYAAVH